MSQETLGSDTIVGIMSQGKDGRRAFFRLAMGLIALAVVAFVVSLVVPLLPRSLASRANEIVRLPQDAKVVRVDSDGNSVGDVYFTLPEPKGPGTRIEEVWAWAGAPPVAGYSFVSGVPARVHSKKWEPLPGAPTYGMVKISKTAPAAKSAKGAHPAPAVGPGAMPSHMMYTSTVAHGVYRYDSGASIVRLEYLRATGQYRFRRILEPAPAYDPSE